MSNLTLEQRLDAAVAEVASKATLITTLTSERDTALAQAAELPALKAQFDSLTVEATTAKAKITELTGQVAAITGERDLAQTKLTAASSNVSRLEKLCDVKGLDHHAAPPTADDPNNPSASHVFDQYAKAEGPARHALYAKHGKEIREEASRRAAAAR